MFVDIAFVIGSQKRAFVIGNLLRCFYCNRRRKFWIDRHWRCRYDLIDNLISKLFEQSNWKSYVVTASRLTFIGSTFLHIVGGGVKSQTMISESASVREARL